MVAVACERWSFTRGSNCSNFTVKGILDKWLPIGGGGFKQEVVNNGSSTVVRDRLLFITWRREDFWGDHLIFGRTKGGISRN